MTEGHLDEACERFGESFRLEMAPGTLLNLALCEQKRGKVTTAWQHYRHLLELLPKDDDRTPFATERLAETEGLLARVTLKVSSGAPSELRVRQGAATFTPASFGAPLPFDPGLLVFEIEAPGREPRRVEIAVAAGEQREVLLEPGPIKGSTATATTPSKKAVHPSRPAAAPQVSSQPAAHASEHPHRTLAYVTLATSATAVLGGLALGYGALRDARTQDSECRHQNGRLECSPKGLSATSRGETLAMWSNVAIAAGAVLGGVGVYLWVSDSPGAKQSAMLGASTVW